METTGSVRDCSSLEIESADELDYITGQPDDTLFLIFSRLPGDTWSDGQHSALNALSLTCRRFHEFLSDEKNLRRLSHPRADLERLSIVQNSSGIGIVLTGEPLPGRVCVFHNYQASVTRRSYRKDDWRFLSGGRKAPCDLGIPPQFIKELRKILMRFNPRCFYIGGASFLSKQATADLSSCLSEFPKFNRLDLCSNLDPGRNTELTPSDLSRFVCNFEKLSKVESRFLVDEVIQSWISDGQYDNYCIKRFIIEMETSSAISMHNFERVSQFDHDLSITTLSDLLDAIETIRLRIEQIRLGLAQSKKRRPSKGILWVLSLSCDKQEIDKVIQDKALKLGYTVNEPWGEKHLGKDNVFVRIEWNRRLQRYTASTFRGPFNGFDKD